MDENIEMPKMKEYRVRFAIGFVLEAEDENQAEQKGIEMLYKDVSDNGSNGFNIDVDEI